MNKTRDKFLKHCSGKYCRVKGRGKTFKNVVDVKVVTQESEVYGSVSLIYIDGSSEVVAGHKHMAALKDVEVLTCKEYIVWKRDQS
jgi:late competence protein required for DNA uptake (superfamily II DNA/RNA helicase)